MAALDRFSKWIKLKIYQFEVTYSVYMLTPMEKFFIYSLLFLLTSLTSIAVFLYLPRHVTFLINRAWFYANGDAAAGMSTGAGDALLKTAGAPADALADTLADAVAGTFDDAATIVREL